MDQMSNQLKLQSWVEIREVLVFQALGIPYLSNLNQMAMKIMVDLMQQSIMVIHIWILEHWILKVKFNCNNLYLVNCTKYEYQISIISKYSESLSNTIFVFSESPPSISQNFFNSTPQNHVEQNSKLRYSNPYDLTCTIWETFQV